MDKTLQKLISEAIALELNISNLYMLFYKLFSEDEAFWWKLVIEEKNHAALLATIDKYTNATGDFPYSLIPKHLNELKESNDKVISIIEDFKKNPDRKRAFELALEIEKSIGEVHYQNFIKHKSSSKIIEVFKKLGSEDVDHAARIKDYLLKTGL